MTVQMGSGDARVQTHFFYQQRNVYVANSNKVRHPK